MAEPDIAGVLDRIVLEVRRFVTAEAATLFVREGQDLRISVFQNEGLAGRLVEHTLRTRRQGPALSLEAPDLPAFAVCSGEILNVPDVYALAPGAAYRFDPTWDRMSEHRTRSMLLIPLVGRAGYILGVLELSNALDEAGELTVFNPDPGSERVVRAFAAQAAVAIENSRLTELSFVDVLTGAFNRRYFLLRLEQESKRHARFEQPYAVVLFDVDSVKSVNDRFGHSAGDGLLTTLSRLLSAQSRGFTVIARLGGDEFGAVLPQTPKAGALQYAERIRRLIEAYPFRHSPVTVSVGVAERRLLVDLVVPVAFQHHQLLRLTGARVHLDGFLWRHEPVVVGRDEQEGARRNLVDDPLRVELQRVVDVFQRDRADGVGIVSPGRGAELGRLPVGQ